jgi:gas vesicle protein
MGYLRGVLHGAIIGGAVALLYAPKPGRETRQDLNDRFTQVRGQVQPVIDSAQGAVQSARPQVERTINKAQQRITGRSGGGAGSETSYAGPASMGTGGAPSPGV